MNGLNPEKIMVNFSVVCPVYNAEKFIEKTINDVLNQTLPPRELIIVDDGSSDNTINILTNLFIPIME